MDAAATRIAEFVDFTHKYIKGDEKGEAQIFCDRLFQAFGHKGIKEAGGELEFRLHPGKTTRFADVVWKPRLLLEMKKKGEKLDRHYRQAFEYWLHAVPNRPRYVTLCNFDDFWVYDLNEQLDEPMDRVGLDELPHRYTALNFLFPKEEEPHFQNNRVAVTRAAADKVAQAFNHLVASNRPQPVARETAQRFVLQCVVAMFAEDIGLLPTDLFTELLHECRGRSSSYDLLGGLFRQMGCAIPATGGRYKEVEYFNGGLFRVVEPIELMIQERTLLEEAAAEDWSKINPAIFGTLFEHSMGKEERHALGAHFTSEADIQSVVHPTIVRPWQDRIKNARSARALVALREELLRYRVLDPACGSGNFLYVAYREVKRLEAEILERLAVDHNLRLRKQLGAPSLVSTDQFFGIDISGFAVELAKVTMMIAKTLALREANERTACGQLHLDFSESPLPLDNLDANIRCNDALFCEWPQANAIIGNPPYLGSRYLAKERGYEYARKIHAAFPAVPKMADYCTHWFRRTHDSLRDGDRAGLVGTNAIRRNESREASLDYIANRGGTITEAVATQVWSGEAQVHVSIVNWVKGEQPGLKRLFTQLGDAKDSPRACEQMPVIGPTLSSKTDVTQARLLFVNEKAKKCFTGQNPVNAGFFLTHEDARRMIAAESGNREVIFPYMIGRDLVEKGGPTRCIIDFAQRDMLSAMKYEVPFHRVKEKVMPVVLERAEREKKAKGEEVTRYTRIAQRWWQFYDYRPGTIAAINSVPRYVACSRTMKRNIFEFVSSAVHADSKLVIFSLADDYSFGILQSGLHWDWIKARGGTQTARSTYTSDTVFDTFPWPQSPMLHLAEAVASAAVDLRLLRRRIMAEHKWSLRDLYRTLEVPGKNPLRDAHDQLDRAVRAAYGMPTKADPLVFLLALNAEVARKEAKGEPITAPGLPPCVTDPAPFITEDCVQPPAL